MEQLISRIRRPMLVLELIKIQVFKQELIESVINLKHGERHSSILTKHVLNRE